VLLSRLDNALEQQVTWLVSVMLFALCCLSTLVNAC
jgi:hypothetical protein